MASVHSQDILIAVLGVTGAGKTTFISNSTGRTDLVIGHGVESCTSRRCIYLSKRLLMTSRVGTQDISFSSLQVAGRTVTLIDTPGFDDTERTDADVLELIAKFLRETYANGMLLTGIILLQPVTGNRVQGSEKRRTRLFEKICGPNAFGHVVIATTMWSELRDESEGQSRVQQRKAAPDFWGQMIDHGAQVVKHHNTAASAISIIRSLINRNTVTLQMQDELQQSDGRLSATSAGQQLHSDLGDTSKKVLAQLEGMQVELRQANQDNASLREEIHELEERLKDLSEQRDKVGNERVSRYFFPSSPVACGGTEGLKISKVLVSSTKPAWISALAAAGSTAVAAAYPIGFCTIL